MNTEPSSPPQQPSFCKEHPKSPASARCLQCFMPICTNCQINHEGKTLCPVCFETATLRVYTSSHWQWGIAICGLLIFLIGFFIPLLDRSNGNLITLFNTIVEFIENITKEGSLKIGPPLRASGLKVILALALLFGMTFPHFWGLLIFLRGLWIAKKDKQAPFPIFLIFSNLLFFCICIAVIAVPLVYITIELFSGPSRIRWEPLIFLFLHFGISISTLAGLIQANRKVKNHYLKLILLDLILGIGLAAWLLFIAGVIIYDRGVFYFFRLFPWSFIIGYIVLITTIFFLYRKGRQAKRNLKPIHLDLIVGMGLAAWLFFFAWVFIYYVIISNIYSYYFFRLFPPSQIIICYVILFTAIFYFYWKCRRAKWKLNLILPDLILGAGLTACSLFITGVYTYYIFKFDRSSINYFFRYFPPSLIIGFVFLITANFFLYREFRHAKRRLEAPRSEETFAFRKLNQRLSE